MRHVVAAWTPIELRIGRIVGISVKKSRFAFIQTLGPPVPAQQGEAVRHAFLERYHQRIVAGGTNILTERQPLIVFAQRTPLDDESSIIRRRELRVVDSRV